MSMRHRPPFVELSTDCFRLLFTPVQLPNSGRGAGGATEFGVVLYAVRRKAIAR